MNEIIWTRKAVRQVLKLQPKDRKTIYSKVNELVYFPETANVKKLKNFNYEYRLRVGIYRVFFNFDGGVKIISIEEVKKRDERTY